MPIRRSFVRWAFVFLCLFPAVSASAPKPNRSVDGVWEETVASDVAASSAEPRLQPLAGTFFRVQPALLRQRLDGAPREFTAAAKGAVQVLTLPMPGGEYADFRIEESPVMHPDLAAKFPGIKTYVGQGIDDPCACARLDWTSKGFHAQVLSPRGAFYIDPCLEGDTTLYICYYKRDYVRPGKAFTCLVTGNPVAPAASRAQGTIVASGDTLRTYRLATACTGEYAQFHGGTLSNAMAAIVTTINRVTGIYELELAVRMELVANNDEIVFLNSSTDPYSNNNGSVMLSQNTATLNSRIGSANFDIGHVFSTGGGGIAGLGVVCGTRKAEGVTGSDEPNGDPFDVDFVAHEMGHQFDGNHTFNGDSGSCSDGNRNGGTAYEPGSGATIQAYAGICGNDDLQPNSDPYFHSESHVEMYAFVNSGGGAGCAATSATGNNLPTVQAGPNFTIPASTPFKLTAAGSDLDGGDVLTYNWEQRDLGPQRDVNASDNGSSPLFRSWEATTSPVRYLPRLQDLVNNTTVVGETLPTAGRIMDWRVGVRDNRANGGGYHADDLEVTVVASAGPFQVTFPNAAITLSGQQTVNWNVANTSGGSVNTPNVNIHLSIDGGMTYPTPLATGVPNNGSAVVILPNIDTSTARIMVEGAGNIFFDISNADFTIERADDLSISPATRLDSTGGQLGPFNPACETYTLTNASAVQLIWSAGASESWITLSTSGDTLAGFDTQDVDVCIDPAANALALGNYSGTVSFTNTQNGVFQQRQVDLEVLPVGGSLAFSMGTYPVNEGDGTVAVTVNRSDDTTGAVGVTYTTTNGSALAGSDYATASSTLTWADGDGAPKQFTVPIIENLEVEALESFTVTLSGPTGGAQLGSPAAATVQITDNDSNDQCSGAAPIPSTPFSTTLATGASTSTGDPSPGCVPTFGNGVWYSYSAPTNGTLSVDTEGSDFDAGIAIYSGACGGLIEITCDDDDGSGLNASVGSPVGTGLTYLILVGGYNSQVGNLQLNVDFVPGGGGSGDNDDCANALDIAVTPFGHTRTTVTAGSAGDPSPACIFNPGNGVWYTFTPPGDGTLEIHTEGSGFDTFLGVYVGGCGSLTEIACNDDSGEGLISRIILGVDAGLPIQILAGGYDGDSGSLSFSADFTPGVCVNLLADSGFEAGDPWPAWQQFSTQFGTPLCNTIECPPDATFGPFSGSNWVNFFGPDEFTIELATLRQVVTIPTGVTARLQFQLWVGDVQSPLTDVLQVRVDGILQERYDEDFVEEGYSIRSIPLDAFADGGSHPILFSFFSPALGGFSEFSVDDIVLEVCQPDADVDGIADPADSDDDNDGMSDLDESVADTDPKNPLSFLALGIQPRTVPIFQPLFFESSAAREYYIDYTADLMLPVWINVLTNEPGNGATMSITVPDTGTPVFYRLGVEAP